MRAGGSVGPTKQVRGPHQGTLIPPFRLAIVEQGLYRGAYPRQRNLRFLKRCYYPTFHWVCLSICTHYENRLKLKTIVSLLPSVPSEDLLNFCKHHDIRFACKKQKYGLLSENKRLKRLLLFFWRHLHIEVSKPKDEVTVPPTQVARILEVWKSLYENQLFEFAWLESMHHMF